MGLPGVFRGERRPPRVCLYGPPGIGKTTFGADAPSPILVATEDGADSVHVDQFPLAASWADVLSSLSHIAEDDHAYKTIVIDTMNGAADLCAKHICETMFGGQWMAQSGKGGFLSFGQGWKATSEEFRRALEALDRCRARGMTAILLAHTGLHNVRHPYQGDYTKFAPDVDKSVWARVSAWCDIVLRAEYESAVVGVDQKTGRGKVRSTSKRVVIASGSAAEDAKCRVGYELPDRMGLRWEEFAGQLGGSSSTLDEARALWYVLSDDESKKTMQWLGVERLEDAPLTKMRQVLDKLRGRAAERTEEESEVQK